jgi:hypothetical protein
MYRSLARLPTSPPAAPSSKAQRLRSAFPEMQSSRVVFPSPWRHRGQTGAPFDYVVWRVRSVRANLACTNGRIARLTTSASRHQSVLLFPKPLRAAKFSILSLAVRRKGIARWAALHLDCAHFADGRSVSVAFEEQLLIPQQHRIWPFRSAYPRVACLRTLNEDHRR